LGFNQIIIINIDYYLVVGDEGGVLSSVLILHIQQQSAHLDRRMCVIE